MKPKEIKEEIKDTPWMSLSQAVSMTNFIIENKINNILELGFQHGVSTCYMAGAIDEIGSGRITTIDLEYTRDISPNIETFLTNLGLKKYVNIFYEPTSYVWRLMKMIEENTSPGFDLCYIDGAHSWFVDGFAFFLVDKLLLPGGWIIFDDLTWTYANCPVSKGTDRLKNMPIEEKETPQVQKVYNLLVKQHPSYDHFMVKNGWAYAHKSIASKKTESSFVKKELVYQNVGLGEAFLRIARRINKLFSPPPK